jgi:hypothetical protein
MLKSAKQNFPNKDFFELNMTNIDNSILKEK